MAGERKGKTYEAIVMVALQHLKENGFLSGDIFWNCTPKGITVEPDFLVGPDKDHPKLVFMVTHFGASSASQKKVWRNIGELCELKTHLNSIEAYNIIFDAHIKDSLKKLQSVVFDGQLIVGDTPYGLVISGCADQMDLSLPTDQNDRAKTIQEISTKNKELSSAIQSLEKDLLSLLNKKQPRAKSLWMLEKNRSIKDTPKSKNTFIRRGCCKLTIFEDIKEAINLYNGKHITEVPEYIYTMGFAKKVIGHVQPCDEEIKQAIKLLKKETINKIVNSVSKNELFNSWINQIRNSSNTRFMWNYVKDEYQNLIDSDKLYERLIQLHDNPHALIEDQKKPLNWPPNNVWLFEIIMEIIRSHSGYANGYGYSQLAIEVSHNSYLQTKYSNKTTQFLLSPWGHLSDWSSRNSRCVIPNDVINCISTVLSNHLSEMGIEGLVKTEKSITQDYVKSLFETRMCIYREFDPLKVILDSTFPRSSTITIRTCFSEAAGLGGQTGNATVLKVKKTLIYWQTATDAGKDHKRKELYGRAVGLRYAWDCKTTSFILRKGIKKLILFLDGTWSQKDLSALISAGWDEIYYPDEIDKLKAAIV